MYAESILEAIAAIGVSLAGFAGIVGALAGAKLDFGWPQPRVRCAVSLPAVLPRCTRSRFVGRFERLRDRPHRLQSRVLYASLPAGTT